jgi:anti-sigma B factor antagonist
MTTIRGGTTAAGAKAPVLGLPETARVAMACTCLWAAGVQAARATATTLRRPACRAGAAATCRCRHRLPHGSAAPAGAPLRSTGWTDSVSASLRGLIDFGLNDEAVDERTHVVVPRGEVDALTAPQLGRRLLGLADEGKTRVVVDLSNVTFMDSTGIGVLLYALKHLRVRKGGLVLVCPTERIMRPFQITGLVGHLRIFGSREQALGGLAGSFA